MISIPERLALQEEAEKKAFDNYDFDLRVASPGIIQSFDAAKQTVTVQVAIREKIKIEGQISDAVIPLLVDVPIVIPQAGGYRLTFPIEVGDECLVIFSDTCFDAWYQNGGLQNQMSLRRHDLSDGFAILGIKSQPNSIANYSTDSVQLRNEAGTNYVEIAESEMNLVFGSTTITLSSAGIEITGNVTMNNNLEVKGTTDLDTDTTIEGETFMGHQHYVSGGETGGVVPEGN